MKSVRSDIVSDCAAAGSSSVNTDTTLCPGIWGGFDSRAAFKVKLQNFTYLLACGPCCSNHSFDLRHDEKCDLKDDYLQWKLNDVLQTPPLTRFCGQPKKQQRDKEIDVDWISNICETEKKDQIRKKLSLVTRKNSSKKLTLKNSIIKNFTSFSKSGEEKSQLNITKSISKQQTEVPRANNSMLRKSENKEVQENSATTNLLNNDESVASQFLSSDLRIIQIPSVKQLSSASIGTFGSDIAGFSPITVLQLDATLETPKTFDQLLRNSLFKVCFKNLL